MTLAVPHLDCRCLVGRAKIRGMGWSLNPSQVRQGDSEPPPAPAPLSTVGCVLSGAGPGWGSVSLELGFSLPKCRCLRALVLRPSLCRSTRTLQKSSGQCLHTQPVQGEAGAWGDSLAEAVEKPSGPRCGCPLTCFMGRGVSSTVRASGTKVCSPREYLERAWVHVHPSTVEAGERRAHQIRKSSWQSC